MTGKWQFGHTRRHRSTSRKMMDAHAGIGNARRDDTQLPVHRRQRGGGRKIDATTRGIDIKEAAAIVIDCACSPFCGSFGLSP